MMTILDFNSAKPIAQIEAEQRTRAQVDAEDIKRRIDPRAFVQWLFSGRALCSKHEARIGDVLGTPGASLSVTLTGPGAGLWHDHATGEGGDLIALYMAHMGYANGKNFQLALKEIAAEFLGDPVKVERSPWQPTAAARIAEKKQKLGDKPRADMLELGAPVATYKYRDLHGNVVASVVRFEPDGTRESKTFRPFCFRTVDGARKWIMGAPELRPLYRLPEIALAPVVVLCEGEGCADALAGLGIEATSAMQGAKSPVEKTDWSPLHGKTVVIWPDNDEPGFAYGRAAAARLAAIGCDVRLVDIPADARPKWDAADCVAEGRDPRALIDAAVPYTEAPPPPRIRLLDIDELDSMAPPAWLVDGVLTRNGLSVAWGKSGALKSFFASDLGLCVATGLPWHGRAVEAGLVIYIAAEGAHGLTRRIKGWRSTKGKAAARPAFKLVPHAVALTGDDLQHLVSAVLALDARPVLIVVDTLARTFGAGDENKQADMNAYVAAADTLRERTGAHVMIIHHSGKDEERGERGSNVLRGAADTVININRRGETKLEIINTPPKGKQKDAEEFATLKLRTQKVSYDHDGAEQTTLVLMIDDDPTPDGEEESAEEAKVGKVEQQIIKALREAGEPLGFTRLGLMTGAIKGSLGRALETLNDKGLVIRADDGDGDRKLWKLSK